MNSNWSDIESDPGIFAELLGQFGVENVNVEEIYSFDQEPLTHSYGYIFLFKWSLTHSLAHLLIHSLIHLLTHSHRSSDHDIRPVVDYTTVPDLFYAKQVITNACGTIAILNIIFNNTNMIKLGPVLEEFYNFSKDFDPETKGLAIGNSDLIRDAHNSFARPEPFIREESSKPVKSGEDVYHFIAYVPFQGAVYELDGLKEGPILLGTYDERSISWKDVARPAIEARMAKYSASETHFTLLSVCEDRRYVIGNEINMITSQLDSSSNEELVNQLEALRNELNDENKKRELQHKENVRRRHNYIGFIMHVLKALAQNNKLTPCITAAETKQKSKK